MSIKKNLEKDCVKISFQWKHKSGAIKQWQQHNRSITENKLHKPEVNPEPEPPSSDSSETSSLDSRAKKNKNNKKKNSRKHQKDESSDPSLRDDSDSSDDSH